MTALLIPHHAAEAVSSRPFAGEDNFWRVRKLLMDTHATTPPNFNWEIRRWDGGRFHDADFTWQPQWCEQVRLWESAAGDLVGVVHPDG